MATQNYTTNTIGHLCKINGKGEKTPVAKADYPFTSLLEDCYAADLETTTEAHYEKFNETHAWVGGIMSITNEEDRYVALSMGELMLHYKNLAEKHAPYPAIIAYHNASFDFAFQENYMLQNGYNCVDDIRASVQFTNVFTVLRNQMGALYGVTIKFGKNKTVKIVDFAKIMPQPLASIGAALDIPKRKDLIDYHKLRPKGYLPTDEELEYLWDDIIILARAWKTVLLDEGCFKLTRSGYAYEAVKREFEITQKNPDLLKFSNFNRMFPATRPENYSKAKFIIDRIILQQQRHAEDPNVTVETPEEAEKIFSDVKDMAGAYQGGKVYCHPRYTNQTINKRMVSIDYTSLYPSQWLNHFFPCGEPVPFEGRYFYDKKHPLYIQKFKASFTMKKGAFPCLAKKLSKNGKQIYSNTDLKDPELMLCDVDLELFLDNYDVHTYEPLGGVKFEQVYAPFASFIKKYGDKKTFYGTDEGWNPMLRLMAKLTLNGSYGKFGQSPFLSSKTGFIYEGVTKFNTLILEMQEMSYLPMAIWTTAYGREDLIKMIKIIGVDKVLYDDTDSIKAFCDWESTDPKKNWLLLPEVKEILKSKEFIEEHGTDFNSWEDEAHVEHFKMLREKCYVMHTKHKMKNGTIVDAIDIKAAGLSDEAKALFSMTFDKDGRGLYYDERTGEKVYAYEYEIPQENHKDLYFPVFKDWQEIFNNFEFGREYPGSLTKKQVKGGVLLVAATKVLTEDTIITYETETGETAPILDLFL